MVHLRRVHVVDAPWDEVWPHVADAATADPSDSPSLAAVETTLEPDIGSRMAWLDGPLAGSNASRTVIDEQGSTRLVLEGDFTVPDGMTDSEVLSMVEALDRELMKAVREALVGDGGG